MKKLIFLLLMLPVLAKAQSPVIISQPYLFQKYISVKDSAFLTGTLNSSDSSHKFATTAFVKQNSSGGGVFLLKSDSVLYVTHNYLNTFYGLPDGIASGLVTTISGSNALTTAGSWLISGVSYSKGSTTTTPLEAQDPTLFRQDILYATTSNTILKAVGVLGTDFTAPTIPDNTLAIANIFISPTSVTTTPSTKTPVYTTGNQSVGGRKATSGVWIYNNSVLMHNRPIFTGDHVSFKGDTLVRDTVVYTPESKLFGTTGIYAIGDTLNETAVIYADLTSGNAAISTYDTVSNIGSNVSLNPSDLIINTIDNTGSQSIILQSPSINQPILLGNSNGLGAAYSAHPDFTTGGNLTLTDKQYVDSVAIGAGGTGTVTSVSVVTANGFSGSVATSTTTPAITLSLQNATTSQSGQLTSTDWNTFNGKQAAGSYAILNGSNNFTGGFTSQYNGGSTYPFTSISNAGVTNTTASGTALTMQTNALSWITGGFVGSVVMTPTANRTITIPDATTTLLGTNNTATVTNKDLTSGTNTFPTFNQNTTGSAAKWTTARNLGGNSVDGSANVAFANKFIVQGTADAGLSGAQFLGSLSTGLAKITTSTGVISIAAVGTDYVAPATTVAGFALSSNISLAALTATNSTLTFSGSYDGSTARTVGLNLANGNTFTAEQQIQLTTTQLSLNYDGTNKTTLATGSTGGFTIIPSGGFVSITGGLTSSGFATTNTSGNLFIPGTTTATSETAALWQMAGSTTNYLRTGFGGTNATQISAGSNYSAILVASSPIQTAASSTHNWLTNVGINPTVYVSGGATVNNTASFSVWGASTIGTNNYNGYSLGGASGSNNFWFNRGITRMSGVRIDSLLTGAVGTDAVLTVNSSNNQIGNISASSLAMSVAKADLTAQTTAGNITTFTVGSSTTTFNISAYINVTAVATDVIQAQVTYTDENSTSQTVSFTTISTVSNSTYSPITIRAKNGTVITVKTNLTTGVGTITFDAGARIVQM